MKKQIFLTLLILSLMFSMTACTLFEIFSVDMHGDLEWVEPYEEGLLSYHGNLYLPTDSWLSAKITDDAIEIGWNYNIIFPISYYYAYDKDTPLYILHTQAGAALNKQSSEIYFKIDYDWRNQPFLIEDTEVEVTLSEVFTQKEVDIEPGNKGWYSFSLCLRDDPRIKFQKEVYQSDDNYYFVFNGERWFLTDSFVELLQELDILP